MDGFDIAVIGMAGRFPGSPDLETFWKNLAAGRESISFFTSDGAHGRGQGHGERVVNATGVIEGADLFDAEFFGYSPREAELMDPQQRLFLEYAWIALESAGYDPLACPGAVGVFGGASMDTYLLQLLSGQGSDGSAADVDHFQLMLLNNRDFLTTRVSYKLNLKGPSINVQTACSTSLVAVHCACTSLLNYQCDMALAGGVSVRVPRRSGYVFREGMIFSPDGHCRAFDADAQGTVPGEGVGIVVLKRLDDAVADRDHIHAVIKGGAINNDGFQKVGFTAPSEAGQLEAIVNAQALAGFEPDGITYIETHGTGTRLGDPIEIAALREAFASRSQEKQFCAIGALKTNIGHLDAAAGVAGLIKTILCLERRMIPPTLHYRSPNPQIEFEQTPFFVNTELRLWESVGQPRRAGVSSFGFGGTNAHLVLEEAAERSRTNGDDRRYVFPLSTRTASRLNVAAEELAHYLETHPEISLRDVAFTLQSGRHQFEHRIAVVASNREDLIRGLRNREWSREEIEYNTDLDARRVPLPTYPFDRKRYWVETSAPLTRTDFSNWFHFPTWQRADLHTSNANGARRRYLLFCDEFGVAEGLAARLREHGKEVVLVRSGSSFLAVSTTEYVIDIGSESDYRELMRGLQMVGKLPTDIVHCLSFNSESRQTGFDSLLLLSHALATRADGTRLRLLVVSNALFEVTGGETIYPRKATILGPCKVMPQELPDLKCISVDAGDSDLDLLVSEALNDTDEAIVAYRNGHRWVQSIQTLPLNNEDGQRLRKNGVYLITGGLGGVGMLLSDYLARNYQARLVLVNRGTTDHTDLAGWEEEAARDLDPTRFHGELYPQMRRLCVAHVRRYLESARNDVQPQFERFHQFMLRLVDGVEDAGDPKELQQSLIKSFPQFRQVYELLDYCVQSYPQVLSGEVKGLDVLFPKGQTDFLEKSLGHLPELDGTVYKRVLRRLLLALTEKRERPLRILELGGGVGLLTRFLLPELRGKNVEYCFTDIGTSFLLAAQDWTTAADREFVTFEKLDVSRDPLAQGFTPNSFDVIIGLDVVHATPDIDATIGNLRKLLAPGGWLSLIEMVTPWPWIEMIWGLTDDWWGFEDFRKQTGTPLADIGQWEQVLSEHEFGSVEIYPKRADARADADYALIVARNQAQSHSEIERLEKLGAEVLVAKADVSDIHQMAAVLSTARARFGQINGVIHAAGVPGGGVMVRQTPDDADEVFKSKVDGTLVLHRLFQDQKLDFFLLWSSVASFVGGTGQATYTAASAALDAYANSQHNPRRFTCSINWPLWNNVGTAVPVQQRHLEWTGKQRGDVIEPDDAIRAMLRVLSLDRASQVCVSPVPLQTLIEGFKDLWRRGDELLDGPPPEAKAKPAHARPELATTYSAPKDELEKAIAAIWSDALGVGDLGRDDNFFELGGDSLVAVKVISQIKRAWNIELSAVAMFELPTIARIADEIRGMNGDRNSFQESLKEIDDLQNKRKAARDRRNKAAYAGD